MFLLLSFTPLLVTRYFGPPLGHGQVATVLRVEADNLALGNPVIPVAEIDEVGFRGFFHHRAIWEPDGLFFFHYFLPVLVNMMALARPVSPSFNASPKC